jgi:hypothetical protein
MLVTCAGRYLRNIILKNKKNKNCLYKIHKLTVLLICKDVFNNATK